MKLEVGHIVELNSPVESIIVNLELKDEWQDFGDKGDRIKPLKFEDEDNTASVCLYSSLSGNTFYWHTHSTIESGVCYGQVDIYIGNVVNEDTHKILVIDKYQLSYGDTFKIEAGVPHLFFFKSNTKLLLGWHPEFKGKDWEAEMMLADKENRNYNVLDALTIGAQKLFD